MALNRCFLGSTDGDVRNDPYPLSPLGSQELDGFPRGAENGPGKQPWSSIHGWFSEGETNHVRVTPSCKPHESEPDRPTLEVPGWGHGAKPCNNGWSTKPMKLLTAHTAATLHIPSLQYQASSQSCKAPMPQTAETLTPSNASKRSSSQQRAAWKLQGTLRQLSSCTVQAERRRSLDRTNLRNQFWAHSRICNFSSCKVQTELWHHFHNTNELDLHYITTGIFLRLVCHYPAVVVVVGWLLGWQCKWPNSNT